MAAHGFMMATVAHPGLYCTQMFIISFVLTPFRLGASITDLYVNQIVKESCTQATSAAALQ